MSTFNRLLFIASLSSVFLLAGQSKPFERGDLSLGFAQFETLTVTGSGGKHTPFIVVRASNKAGKIQSFGLSNEAGVLGMPLPPGEYCYDAFSQAGHHLEMNRPESERCFEVKQDQVTEVGVGLKP